MSILPPPIDPDEDQMPFDPTSSEPSRAGSGIRWGLLVFGVLLIALGIFREGYLVNVPDWLRAVFLVGGGGLLVLLALREWMARKKS